MYSELILELYKNPSNYGFIPNPTLHLEGGNPICGDQVSFDLIVEKGIIKEIKFQCQGCAISKASESLLTEMVNGKKIEEALKLESKDMFELLGNVIETRIKCALLGLHVIKIGLEEFKKTKQKQKITMTGITI